MMKKPMPFAVVHGADMQRVDAVLDAVIIALTSANHRVCGLLNGEPAGADSHACDRLLVCAETGHRFAISQRLGQDARGCRLDHPALEAALAHVAQRFHAKRPALLILNRFGRLETRGRGALPLIVQALSVGVPVLVGVNAMNLEALERFADGMADVLPPSLGPVRHWLDAVLEAPPIPMPQQASSCGSLETFPIFGPTGVGMFPG